MSLFSTLQLASNALQAQQIGLQVVGQNIANVNTPGYSRATVNLTPAATQRVGKLLLGLGVQVDSIVQVTDAHLNGRLRAAVADRVGGEVQESAYQQLEGILGELQDTDLSTSMNKFFSSISQILDQPESTSLRNLAVLQGQTLAVEVGRLADRAIDIRNDLNNQLVGIAPDVNRLLKRISELNVKITTTEGGSESGSDAVGLRDERNVALQKLSELIDIKTTEQHSGAVNIFAGGDFLVFEGTYRSVKVSYGESGDTNSDAILTIVETDSPLQLESGKAAGLIDARDNILDKFIDNLNDFAKTLAFEFNKVYASGQGLTGYSQLTAERAVTDTSAPLDVSGLPFRPVNGSFDVLIRNEQTGLTQTTRITVDLNGLDGDDTTFESLRAQLDAVDGLSATVDVNGRLVLASESPNARFSFSNDTSGTLAALGVNTFFSGSSATDLGVNKAVVSDPTKFAASRSGIDGDTSNAVDLAAFLNRPLETADGRSINQVYGQVVNDVTQGASIAHSVAEGYRTFEATLYGQQLAVSGVSLDEEAVTMLSYQRAYQATARLIQTINELMETLAGL
jgi:flagellar hook-associated protein 1 FlgK